MAYINMRVDDEHLKQFKNTCAEFGRNPNDTIRELICSFGENRITITPTEKQKKGKEVYHEPRE